MKSLVAYQNPLQAWVWSNPWVSVPLLGGILLLAYEIKKNSGRSSDTTAISGEVHSPNQVVSTNYRWL